MIQLNDLPKSSKSAWPWQVEPSAVEDKADAQLPSISIIIPNYNYAQYIEEAIRSVLLQGYTKLELIVIDGNSDDGSQAVIEKYLPWINHYESESDSGQSEAINKGISRATGDIIAYLNSDDMYKAGALHTVGQYFADESQCEWLVGVADIIDSQQIVKEQYRISSKRARINLIEGLWLPQPATFWRRELHDRFGTFNESLVLTMDQEWWARLAINNLEPDIIESTLAVHRDHGENKTSGAYSLSEARERISILRSCREQVSQQDARILDSKIALHEDYILCKDLEMMKGVLPFFQALWKRPRLIFNRMFLGSFRNSLLGRT